MALATTIITSGYVGCLVVLARASPAAANRRHHHHVAHPPRHAAHHVATAPLAAGRCPTPRLLIMSPPTPLPTTLFVLLLPLVGLGCVDAAAAECVLCRCVACCCVTACHCAALPSCLCQATTDAACLLCSPAGVLVMFALVIVSTLAAAFFISFMSPLLLCRCTAAATTANTATTA